MTKSTAVIKILNSEAITPDAKIMMLTRPGVLSDRALRFFACWCSGGNYDDYTDALAAAVAAANGQVFRKAYAADIMNNGNEMAVQVAVRAARQSQVDYLRKALTE